MWKLAVENPKLQELARNTVVLFGSAHLREAEISRMQTRVQMQPREYGKLDQHY